MTSHADPLGGQSAAFTAKLGMLSLTRMAPAGAARFLPPVEDNDFLSLGAGGGGAIRRSQTMQ